MFKNKANKDPVLGDVKVNDYIWVKFTENKLYAGKVIKLYGNWEFEVKFLRHQSRSTFVWPSLQDVSDIEFPQIVRILSRPMEGRRGELTFSEIDLFCI
jgi:hypothetical protein